MGDTWEKKVCPIWFWTWCCPISSTSRQNYVVGTRTIADDRASSVFEAIETIVWKPAIASVVPIVSKFLETTGTIIWNQALTAPKLNKSTIVGTLK